MAQICKQAPEFDSVALMPDQSFANIKLSELLNKDEWIVLFFYPLDFTFVCPTEVCCVFLSLHHLLFISIV